MENHSTLPKNGVRREFQLLEKEVWQWAVNEKAKNDKLPAKKSIQNYALNLYTKAGYKDFKASLGWYRRWEKRYNLKSMKNNTNNRTPGALKLKRKRSKDCINDYLSNDGILDSFSSETDKLIGNIDMIDSPSEFFNFSDSFDKSLDSSDILDSLKSVSETDNMKNFIKELIDDFGKYFSDKEDNPTKFVKKSCKYDDDFKEQVISYLKDHCLKDAASKFNVNPNTLSIWLKDDDFQKHLNEVILKHRIKNVENESVIKEKEFLNWLLEHEKKNVIVSKAEVKSKIKDLQISSTISMNSTWFMKYCNKYINGNQSNTAMKIRYSSQFQKLMVNYANRTSQIRAASVFNLARKQLFNWMKNIQSENILNKQQADEKLLKWYDSQKLKPNSKTIRAKGKELHCAEGTDITCSHTWYYNWCMKHGISVKRKCDEEIVKWILEAYDKNLSVSHQDVQGKAIEIYRKQKDNNFKASSGWLLRFCRRYMNLLRRVPSLSTELPVSCEDEVVKFRQHLYNVKLNFQVDDESFGVMDELFLKLKPLGTVDGNKKKTLLRNCGMNNIQGTVLLSCLANGRILPFVLVLKDKSIPNTTKNGIVKYQSKGNIDDNVLTFWMENIWFKYVKSPNLLLVDCFDPHNGPIFNETFLKKESIIEIIPKGCSSKLNPLLQVFIPQFQETIDESYRKWFDDNNYSWQIEGSSSMLSSEDIVDWIGKAFDNVNTALMMESIKDMFKNMDLTEVDHT